ncbi:MAG TPA: hypothetical protein VN603_07925 [Candidatus Acidoferrales bacterium]|nr:hypothetical protein [Candidatus Acidoferrales bacterium]
MAETVRPVDLRLGDVLLYHGTGPMADLIRDFEGPGAAYSHAGIFDGANVMESLPGVGIQISSIVKSVDVHLFVDVFRFQSHDGKDLDDAGYTSIPLANRIEFYESNAEQYAYEPSLLVAVLAATRRVPLGTLSTVLSRVLDDAGAELDKILAAGKEPLISSELVSRCYAEAGREYRLVVVRKTAQGNAAWNRSAPTEPETPDDADVRRRAASFLARYAVAKSVPVEVSAEGTVAGPALNVADFVTPHDLSRSISLYKIGRLQL